jgi:hypothetical protein
MLDLNEFIGFRKQCLICGKDNKISMQGTINETLDDNMISVFYNFFDCVNRKKFITFSYHQYVVFAPGIEIDTETLNTNKYSTFVLRKDGYVEFDKMFEFKMRITISSTCSDKHYSYTSRKIRINEQSMDISKGYPVQEEELNNANYKIVSNHKTKKTHISNTEIDSKPITIPFKEIDSFPYQDDDRFVKKLQNILLLA